MYVWRISSKKYQATAFSGNGGLYVSGRWHSQGVKIVYTAESLALASLEIFVHLESDNVPLVGIKAWLDNQMEIEEITSDRMSDNWQDTSAYPKLQKLGRDWLREQRTPVLKVPSAVVPVEFNYLLNPQHPKFKVVLEPPTKFKFDRRMWKVDL